MTDKTTSNKPRRMRRSEQSGVQVQGHVTIRDWSPDAPDEVRTLLSKRNAVHRENMALALARSMGSRSTGHVYTMHFGTGGSTVDNLGNVVYETPNVTGAADLNTPAYHETVDDTADPPSGNGCQIRHIAGTEFADIEIRCVLDKTEPFGQNAFDNLDQNLSDGAFVFDEIGLKTSDGLLLTHIVFSPIEKTGNRILEVVYLLRFTLA